MDVRLAYGKTGLVIHLKDDWSIKVVEPQYIPGMPNPLQALHQALINPIGTASLAELIKPTDRVGIIINDITRPTPTPILLRALLAELIKVPQDHITVFIALGTHRPSTNEELREMVGAEIAATYQIVQNNAFDPASQIYLGQTSQGHPIWINRLLMQCDVKILTGFIEPHFFAGFSGAGKAIMPGMAGLSTIMGNHSAENIAHPNATWGHTWGNPIWEEIREVAWRVRPTFLLNITLNRDKEITGIYAGDLDQAHAKGVEFVRNTALVELDQLYDIVVTTNSGYPSDLNLYQSVKGMSAAAQIVREGGVIIIATECWDGIPIHGDYSQLLMESLGPAELHNKILSPNFSRQDQWQAQIQAQIQLKCDIYVYSGYLKSNQIRSALLEPTESVEAALEKAIRKVGPKARICILPEGPQTIPYIHKPPL